MKELFVKLQIKPTEKTQEVIGKVTNKRTEEKMKMGQTVTVDYCKARIEQYILKYKEKGIDIPNLPNMSLIP